MPSLKPVPPNSLDAALAHVAAGGRLAVPTATRVTWIDRKTVDAFDRAGAWLLKPEGDGYRLRSGKSSVFLFPGQLCFA